MLPPIDGRDARPTRADESRLENIMFPAATEENNALTFWPFSCALSVALHLKKEAPGMNSLVVDAVVIRENPSQYFIRYGVEHDRFAQVLSSVSSRSVLLVGATREKTRKPAYSLIAVIPLTASVDPDQTTASFEGNEFVLRLVKCPLEKTLIPVTERSETGAREQSDSVNKCS
jgi:hypothetical protein